MRKILNHPQWICLMLLAVSLIAYGALILQPGAFGADMSILWLHQRSGLAGLEAHFGPQQLVAALLTDGLLNIFGAQMWIYHLLVVLLRWLGAWAFWLLIREMWPKQDGKTLLAALVFLVFPGMKHTPVALSILPHLLALALTGVGLLFVYRGIVDPRRRGLDFAAAWLSGLAMLLSHYFVGLEVARLLVIWQGWGREKKLSREGRLKKTALTWLPYAPILTARFMLGFPMGAPSEAGGLVASVRGVARSVVDMLVLAWRQVFDIPSAKEEILGFLLAILIAGLMAFLVLRKTAERPHPLKKSEKTGESGPIGFLAVGAIVFVVGGLPVWIGREAVGLGYPTSLSALAFLPGTALLFAGVFDLLLLPRFQAGLAALIVALSVGAQAQNTNAFMTEWRRAEKIVQQLKIRLPAVNAGTLLVSEQLPLDTYTEENLTAMLNLIYFPNRKGEMDGLLYVNAGFDAQAAPEGLIERAGEGFHFSGSLSQSAAFYQPEAGCLRLLRPGEADPKNLPFTLGQSLDQFKMENVFPVKTPNLPLPDLFQSTTEADRCAALARIEWVNAQGNWKESARLAAKYAEDLRATEHPYELAPLIEAAAHAGDAENFTDITAQAITDEGAPLEVCRAFTRIDASADVPPAMKSAVEELKNRGNCGKYD